MDEIIASSRRDALGAFAAAVASVRPERLLAGARRTGPGIEIAGLVIPPSRGRRLVAALGKAAPGLALGWLENLASPSDELVVLTPHGVPVPPGVSARAVVWRGAHPAPDAAGAAACRDLLERVGVLGHGDQLVVLLSGGASALLATPRPGLSLEAVRTTTGLLMRAGAAIGELNTVRRELLAAAGGGLARAAQPAEVVTLVLSDVLGDPLPDIASGPTVPSPTGAGDARAVLERFGLLGEVPAEVTRHLEARRSRQVPDPGPPGPTRAAILASIRTAVSAAAAALADRGYAVECPEEPVLGEASVQGHHLGGLAARLAGTGPQAVVLGGETTVTVRGAGRGGRSQELALAASLALDGAGPCALLAGGTDGVDGASDNAGAVVDATTVRRLRAAGIDPRTALAANDSATALEAVHDVVVTGPTGTNVCDLVIVVARPHGADRR